MKNNFQERFLLSLCSEEENIQIVKTILRSPLGLAQEIIRLLFDNNFKEVKDNLDSIKQFVAGITRSESLGQNYSLAKFYPYLFSFHQFVHSSYRARQGKTLEELFKEVIRRANKDFVVPDKEKDKHAVMSEVFKGYDSRLDIDVVAKKSKGKVLALQLRSRDDTGGTTAKGSLVEALRRVMKKNVEKDTDLFYLIGIWDKIKSNQKNITISKIYEALEPYFQKPITKEFFIENIEKGINLHKGVKLKLAYGDKEIVKNVSEWVGEDTKLDYSDMEKIIDTLESSDDLWLAYVIASLELENIELKNINNIEYLNELLKDEKYDTSNFKLNEEYLKLANELALKIIPKWDKDSLPVSTMSEKAHYIRDLILLRFVHDIS
ncbi:hypothetical protein AUJ84_03825 [Candidatus Pacearchaeota archaeon CG1_02_32_132]|nr:MAG: hypothetical protein AUJ84_03825 [Candidatus Pacearchaeota archaeon CG1_02_32_132]